MTFAFRTVVLAGCLLGSYSGTVPFDAVPDALAHGKPMNLTQYCKDTYETGLFPLPWRAKYLRDRADSGLWQCIQERRQGLNTMMGGGVKNIDPSKACLAQHGTSRIHFHEGEDPGKSSDMHCGLFMGTVPLPRPSAPPPAPVEDRRHAVIEVCNQTGAEKIAVGYAYKDYKSSTLQARGWWPVKKGACFDMPLPAVNSKNTPYRGAAYLFGYHSKAVLKGNGTDICINMGRKFSLNSADNPDKCALGNNQTMIDTLKINMGPGKISHTYRD